MNVNSNQDKFATSQVITAERPDGSTPENVETTMQEKPLNEMQHSMALFSGDQVNDLRKRWEDIQAKFVDEPRHSVDEADALVADTINRLTENFTNERNKLNGHWERDQQVPTEDLRLAVLRYRSFFDRLLSAGF